MKSDYIVPIIFLGVVTLWLILAVPLYAFHHFYPAYAGNLGDTFGIINSIFSAVAFAGAVYSIRQQSKVIAKQDEQIKQERIDREGAMRQQNIQIENDRKDRHIDRFESTFMNLLSAHQQLTLNLTTRNDKGDFISGTYLFEHLSTVIRNLMFQPDVVESQDYQLKLIYNEEIYQEIAPIKQYTKSINVALQYIEMNRLNRQEKIFYYTIALSRLQQDEIDFLKFHSAYHNNPDEVQRLKELLKSDQ